MRQLRKRRSVACLCVAAVLFAAFAIGVPAFDYAVPEPGWVLLPDLSTRPSLLPIEPRGPMPAAVVPPVPGRAPPAAPMHA